MEVDRQSGLALIAFGSSILSSGIGSAGCSSVWTASLKEILPDAVGEVPACPVSFSAQYFCCSEAACQRLSMRAKSYRCT